MWIPDYIEEVETDFAAIYGILDMWSLDSVRFLRFAARLMYYEGAVRGKIKVDYSEEQEDGTYKLRADTSQGPTKKIKMSDAMQQYGGDELNSFNLESQQAGMGDLFERVTVPGN